MQRWENGSIKTLRYENIVKLAEALETTPSYLMGWEDFDVYHYDEEGKKFIAEKEELHRMVDEASEQQITLIELLLKLPTPQLEALALLTARSRDDTEL